MSEHPACWRCVYFDREQGETEDGGFCRRYPPAVLWTDGVSMWAGVEYLDWCGEYRAEVDA